MRSRGLLGGGSAWRLGAVALSLVAAPAWAQEALPPEQAAQQASQVVERWCDDVAAGDTIGAAEAVAEVAAAWADVGRAHEAQPLPYLLYWRGVLGQCLSQDERALLDLRRFVGLAREDAEQAAVVEDARRRIRMLERGDRRPAPARGGVGPGLGVGIGVAAAGLAATVTGGVLHGTSFTEAQLTRDGERWTSASTATPQEWSALTGRNRAGFGLLVGGAVTWVTGGVVAALGGASRGPRTLTGIWVLPHDDGFALGFGGEF